MKNYEVIILQIFDDFKQYKKEIEKIKAVHLNNSELLININKTVRLWFSNNDYFKGFLETDIYIKYNDFFSKLLELSNGKNRVISFKKYITSVLKDYKKDFIIKSQKTIVKENNDNDFGKLFIELNNNEDSTYLREAIDCAKANFLKASVVLGWCAAVDRIHRCIEKQGFPRFNSISTYMTNQSTGRFKKFNQPQNVNSISELREVFDTTILWIIEGMGLIDLNQHTRLRSCFEMRCHAGHPGDAPITIFNVMSFFSDIEEIIFKSPNFTL